MAALVAVLGAVVLGLVPVTGAGADPQSGSGDPNLAYAIVVNIPEYEQFGGGASRDVPAFTCQLCKTDTGGKSAPDYLATIDLDKKSPTYGQVIARNPVPNTRPELHHMAVSDDADRVVLFDLYQDEANVFDTGTDPRQPQFLKAVDLAEESRALLGPVPGLTDGDGNPLSVGYAMPHVAYRLPNGNFLIAMVSAYVPERPDLDGGAPGGFIEMTPDGDIVSAFPQVTYDAGTGQLGNTAGFAGKGIFSIDYDARLGMMAHADLMTANQFLCAGLLLNPNPNDWGNEIVIWNVDPANASGASIFQKVQLPAPFVTAPAFVPRPVNGMDVIYVTTFSSGLWALTRPTGTNQPFVASHVYPLDQNHGLVHLRLHPKKNVVYLSDPPGNSVHVLDFSKDPLSPKLLQEFKQDEVHMMKFSADGKRFYTSNGLASVLGFAIRPEPFDPHYGIVETKAHGDGRLKSEGMVFDGQTEPNAPQGVFIGDFFVRQNPHPFV